MPHGDWPNYREHHEDSGPKKGKSGCHCCCCSDKCDKDWDRDVFGPFVEKKIKYHAIYTKNRGYKKGFIFKSKKKYNEGFEEVMK